MYIVFKIHLETRKHSSRMRTAASIIVPGGVGYPGGYIPIP